MLEDNKWSRKPPVPWYFTENCGSHAHKTLERAFDCLVNGTGSIFCTDDTVPTTTYRAYSEQDTQSTHRAVLGIKPEKPAPLPKTEVIEPQGKPGTIYRVVVRNTDQNSHIPVIWTCGHRHTTLESAVNCTNSRSLHHYVPRVETNTGKVYDRYGEKIF